MKVWSQRTGRWLAFAALALAVAAFAAPTAGARPLGGLPCDPGCPTVDPQPGSEPQPYQALGGPTPELPRLATLKQFSFEGPQGVPSDPRAVRPDDRPGLRGPGTVDPVVQPLYPITAPLSGPATVPTDATPVTTDAPSGGTDWTAIGIAAGMGALLLVAAGLIIGTSRRRQTPAHA